MFQIQSMELNIASWYCMDAVMQWNYCSFKELPHCVVYVHYILGVIWFGGTIRWSRCPYIISKLRNTVAHIHIAQIPVGRGQLPLVFNVQIIRYIFS